jgi:hypothetical protein
MLELDTPHGPARAHLHQAGDARGALCPATAAAAARPTSCWPRRSRNGLGIAVALAEQPYRVAGRRSTPAAHLLLRWTTNGSLETLLP